MKPFSLFLGLAALLLFGASSYASGAKPSSFVPRGPEPHVSLSDMHHSSKGRGQRASRVKPRAVHKAPGAR